jgi:hypothetical protein
MANVMARDARGHTALHHLFSHRHTPDDFNKTKQVEQIINLLVHHGTKINGITATG